MPKATSGYSSTPLVRKLGIPVDCRLVRIGAPPELDEWVGPWPSGTTWVDDDSQVFDWGILFGLERESFELALDNLVSRLDADGSIWTCWPKKASKVPTDLSFDVVQRAGLGRGLVDNKVCAVSEVYSGLRFVVRVDEREAWRKAQPGGGALS